MPIQIFLVLYVNSISYSDPLPPAEGISTFRQHGYYARQGRNEIIIIMVIPQVRDEGIGSSQNLCLNSKNLN